MLRRRQKLLATALLFSVAYTLLCLYVLQEQNTTERLQDSPISSALFAPAEKHTILHSGDFYRIIATRMQYYAHDPAMVPRFYQVAITKAPANSESFFSYAYYLASVRCCKDQVYRLLQETVRRAPTNSRINRISAACFLSVGDTATALPYFQRALELDPASAQQMYKLLEKSQVPADEMYRITPQQPDSLMQFAQYAISRKNINKDLVQKCLQTISSQQLDSKQRLNFVRLLLSAGYTKEAQDEASLAFRAEDSRMDALRYLADISAQNGNWQQYEKFSKQIEKDLLENGGQDQAAAYAIQSAQVMARIEGNAGLKQRLLRIMNDYPHYAPAFAQMAAVSRTDSAEVQLYYLKQAVDLDPARLDYHRQLASLYLSLNRPREAEKTYQTLVSIPETKKEAYIGIAQCKIAEGDRYQAIAILHQAIERSGDAPEYSWQLGQLYDSIGEFERAAHYYSDYGRTGSNKVTGYNLAGDAYYKLGRYDNAREEYLLALSQDPKNTHASDQLQQLQSLK